MSVTISLHLIHMSLVSLLPTDSRTRPVVACFEFPSAIFGFRNKSLKNVLLIKPV
jgi:hypothetical protein